ncbi:hypothetical protein ACF06V_00135 [Streptomyces bobili]
MQDDLHERTGEWPSAETRASIRAALAVLDADHTVTVTVTR